MTIASVLLLADLWSQFVRPGQVSKPWTYWFWTNTLTDRETIAEESADIAGLGFGGIVLTDSRGYWNDDDHLVVPPAVVNWGGAEWRNLIIAALREAQKHGLRMMINVAASGGHLRGDEDVGADAPKLLKCRRYLPGDRFERPDIPNFHDIAVYAVKTVEPGERSGWENAGDGYLSMEGNVGKREDMASGFGTRAAQDVRQLGSAAEGCGLGAGWTIVRFGWGTIAGREQDVDILDGEAVCRHLGRVFGPIVDEVPDLVGRARPFAGLYNVSWEGAMPTWSTQMCRDFERINGFALLPCLPILAGYDIAGRERSDFMRRFRHARGVMMKTHLYEVVRSWAHRHGMIASSESGGPWGGGARNPATFGECDQLGFLGANDIPQGEFWPNRENLTVPESGRANANGHFLDRAIVSAAHTYDLPICAAEAFTHMHRHWSADPAFLKPIGDIAFANGINRLVWHTYTASPKRFGVPGLEYFAGTHINRNVTWHDELPAYVSYLHRCQELLQLGRQVVDVAILVGDRSYTGWGYPEDGFHRNDAAYGLDVKVPKGYCSDLVNDEAISRNPQLLERYAVVYDARKLENRNKAVPVVGFLPDVETDADWLWCHRRDERADWYFLAGEGRTELTFRATAPQVEIWDAVTATRRVVTDAAVEGCRTRVMVELPKAGSCFVVFDRSAESCAGTERIERCGQRILEGAWTVSFSYPEDMTARPPDPVILSNLVDLTTREDVRHFSGAAVYRKEFWQETVTDVSVLCLSALPSGVARVRLNDVDCGTVWCAPWEVDVTKAIRRGDNRLEVRYVNNWFNRLVGDCSLEDRVRVTRSVVRCWDRDRTYESERKPWTARPTLYSGYCRNDKLQPSGLLGPVVLVQKAKITGGEERPAEK